MVEIREINRIQAGASVSDLLKTVESEPVRKSRPAKPPKKSKYLNSFVIRHKDGRYSGRFEDVNVPVGTPYEYHGYWINLYTAHETDEGEILKPLIPSEELKKLPDALWRAIHWDSYKKLITPLPTLMEKIKLGVALGFFAISAVILFLIIISVAGG